MRRALLLAPLLLGALFAAACVDRSEVETQDIVTAIPWADGERLEYVLLDRDDLEKRVGTGVLAIERKNSRFELQATFEGQGVTDESLILVDDETLKPVSVRRERRNDENVVVQATYDPVEMVIETIITEDGEDPRPIPRRLDEEHYYDNESSVFLWRTIAFAEGYEARYFAVLANQGGTQQLVRLEVKEKEQITVPAGTFDCWRLEMRSSNVRQVAWYADTPQHPLVQYDNSRQVFQLAALE
jgi:hypothetical protein